MRVLNIEVEPAHLLEWAGWLAPDRQPFFLTDDEVRRWRLSGAARDDVTDRQLRDTYLVYNVDKALRPVWLSETEFHALPRQTRAGLVRAQARHERGAVPTVARWGSLLGKAVRDQADGRRFVWWPSLLAEHNATIIPAVITEDLEPSCHSELTNWPVSVLPRAQELAGTWPGGSGPNCFGTVMAAAGVRGAELEWMQRAPFEDWLATSTRRVGTSRHDVPGVVHVWRSTVDNAVQHAAVSLGDGWMLHKPSQSWMTPRKVRPTADAIRATRTPGWRLTRHQLK
ncbi:hypothetical protein OG394_16335 [Kribbella sp. NBC_01245]|uniref:hypothetical protein n=1 Tax=Kribbella sp. NBC_01245 TaxID=2903578 RepID=UPI002E2D3631|nr:hypothetical protein [Kribbella sp. NBC_01245]